MDSGKSLQVEKQKENYLLMDTAFFELKMPCDTVTAADFADSECEASAKSIAACATCEQYNRLNNLCEMFVNLWNFWIYFVKMMLRPKAFDLSDTGLFLADPKVKNPSAGKLEPDL